MIIKKLKKSAAILGAVAGMALLSTASPSQAALITLDATDTGWFDNSGNHSVSNSNYIVGNLGTTQFHNYFTFNLSGLNVPNGQVVTGLQLSLDPFTTSLTTGSNIYNLYDYSSTAASPENVGTGLANYADLGSGTLYGTVPITGAPSSPFVFNLNSAAVSGFNASGNGYFTVGGALVLNNPTGNEFLFGNSFGYPTGQQLLITTEAADPSVAPVPELSTMILVAIGMMGMMGYGWMQSKKKVGSKATFPSIMA